MIIAGRPHLRAVRAVPGDRPDAARRDLRARRSPTSGRPGSTPRSPRATVGLAWWFTRPGRRPLAASTGSSSSLLLGFSTQIWWVTTRGGVWHTGQLIATILTLGCLIELWGSRARLADRPAGRGRVPDPRAARLRDPVLRPAPRRRRSRSWEPRRWPWRAWVGLAPGRPPVARVLLLVQRRALRVAARVGLRAGAPPGLARGPARAGSVLDRPHRDERRLPVHSAAGVHRRRSRSSSRTGSGCRSSSPARGCSTRSARRGATSRTWWLAGAALIVLIPTLLYYGGGWLQFGYRYALDSIPFVWALCALAAARDEARREASGSRAGDRLGWALLILFGVLVGLGGVYWAYHL